MLFWAGRLCAITACLALLGCGRVGVFPIQRVLEDEEPGADPEPLDEAETGSSEQLDAEAADADLSPTQPLDASGPDADHTMDAMPPVAQDAQSDANAQDAGLDAQAARDAAEVSVQDATVDAGAPDVSVAACGGASVLGLCWYLAAQDQSCRDACAGHGGYDSRTASSVGTSAQGGSLDNCRAVLAPLGYAGTVGEGTRPDGLGIGCHLWDPDAWWLASNADFDPDAHANPARIACACLR